MTIRFDTCEKHSYSENNSNLIEVLYIYLGEETSASNALKISKRWVLIVYRKYIY